MANKIKVFFPHQDLEIQVDQGSTVAMACSQAGIILDYVCGGKGTCKKCAVDIERAGKRERVLACRTLVESDLDILVPEDQVNRKANILTSTNLEELELDPAIKKVYIEKKELPLCSSAWEELIPTLGLDSRPSPSIELLRKFSLLGANLNIEGMTLTLWNDELIDVEEGNTSYEAYGFAIDIGTTTVAAYLYDLITGRNLGVYSDLNGQVSEGGDVITRIVKCIDDPSSLKTLQSKVIGTINALINNAIVDHQISKDHIYHIAICGNSAMQHLFLGLHPGNLGRAPFTNVIHRDVTVQAKDLRLNMNPHGIVHFLPLIGGFVGADTTAVMLSLFNQEDNKLRLIIDIGTNGEMVLGNNDRMLAASTAAGPALEGAGIRFGMRGTNGAIERVKLLKGEIELQVIMGEKPQGICGSGLIDVIAEMLKVGIIDASGRLQSREAFLEKCDPKYSALAENLETIDDGKVFVLVREEDSKTGEKIYISQKDIRAVQLAKGAIYTGCRLLIREMGIQGEDIDEILIAGAFGNYIDVKNGQYIGLLPDFDGVPIRSIGNAAGAGVQRFLLSKKIQKDALPLTHNIEHLELASNPNFHEEYFTNLNFPKH